MDLSRAPRRPIVPALARRPQSPYSRPMATAMRHLSLCVPSPLLATGGLLLRGLLLRLAR